ncbi:MAG: hypothetical protein AAF423_03600 [Pseudomonadota bacterium]
MFRLSLNRKFLAIATICSAVNVTAENTVHSADMGFITSSATIGETCLIQLIQGGTFGVSGNQRTLNSQNFGGTAATIHVTSRKRGPLDSPAAAFQITLEPPTAFTIAPPGGDDNVAWRTRFSGVSIQDGVNFNTRRGTRAVTLPEAGTSMTEITGHLRARKPRGQSFPDGSYTAHATFRCE